MKIQKLKHKSLPTKYKKINYQVLFMPGGFGAAKNWSDFGVKGADMTVKDDVAKVMKDFHGEQKYIGLCCIAPVVAAKVFDNLFSCNG